jgi:hypothetical protein
MRDNTNQVNEEAKSELASDLAPVVGDTIENFEPGELDTAELERVSGGCCPGTHIKNVDNG